MSNIVFPKITYGNTKANLLLDGKSVLDTTHGKFHQNLRQFITAARLHEKSVETITFLGKTAFVHGPKLGPKVIQDANTWKKFGSVQEWKIWVRKQFTPPPVPRPFLPKTLEELTQYFAKLYRGNK